MFLIFQTHLNGYEGQIVAVDQLKLEAISAGADRQQLTDFGPLDPGSERPTCAATMSAFLTPRERGC